MTEVGTPGFPSNVWMYAYCNFPVFGELSVILPSVACNPDPNYNLERSTLPVGLHSLRHTHTSLLAEAVVSLEQIMDRLGHTDDQKMCISSLHKKSKKKLPISFVNL